jgi:hypothetical protein
VQRIAVVARLREQREIVATEPERPANRGVRVSVDRGRPLAAVIEPRVVT